MEVSYYYVFLLLLCFSVVGNPWRRRRISFPKFTHQPFSHIILRARLQSAIFFGGREEEKNLSAEGRREGAPYFVPNKKPLLCQAAAAAADTFLLSLVSPLPIFHLEVGTWYCCSRPRETLLQYLSLFRFLTINLTLKEKIIRPCIGLYFATFWYATLRKASSARQRIYECANGKGLPKNKHLLLT